MSDDELRLIENQVSSNKSDVGEFFESKFSKLIGDGESVCFGAGRMGFYALMEVLEIGEGDEVVLQAATCSVMANAILRKGATPIYADIDPNTYGSCVDAIERVLTERTRMIVAQHSFGIPCNIQPIVELATEKNVFLLEDCALTLGSRIDGINCGNFGQAALFSTDNTKPINTLIGGIIYTRSDTLYSQLKVVQDKAKQLSDQKKASLWKQFLFERKYCRPDKNGKMRLVSSMRSKIGFTERPFFDEDYGSNSSTGYPYPSKMPKFIAQLGIQELNRWHHASRVRRVLLSGLLEIFCRHGMRELIPDSYFESKKDIVPLRLAWHQEDGEQVRRKLSVFIDTALTWFMKPVIATPDPLENLGYVYGMCPTSERIGPIMINIPCCIADEWHGTFMNKLELYFETNP